VRQCRRDHAWEFLGRVDKRCWLWVYLCVTNSQIREDAGEQASAAASHPRLTGLAFPTRSDGDDLDDPGVAVESAATLLERLYHEQYPRMVRAARVLVDSRSCAEDVVQDAFARCWLRWGSEPPHNAAAYLYTTTINLARSRRRRRLMRPRLEKSAARNDHTQPRDPAEVAAASASHVQVMMAIRGLPRRQRECLALRHIAELSTNEISSALGISESSVRTHIARALEALREQFTELPRSAIRSEKGTPT